MKHLFFLLILISFAFIKAESQNITILKITDKIITKKIIVNCPLDTAWWKWTTHEGLKTFFGEDNNMFLGIGSPFEIYFSMEQPKGNRGSEGCKVISFLPKKMLSFNWNAPPKFPEIRISNFHTWVVINFKSIDSKKTEIEINQLGWPEGDDWNEVYKYFDSAWETVLKWMEKSCK